jgi:hypothetical protein
LLAGFVGLSASPAKASCPGESWTPPPDVLGSGRRSTCVNRLENNRVFQITSVATGNSLYSNDFDGGVAIAPDGSSVSLSNEGTGIGVNLLGTNCFANGYAVIES